MHYAIQLMQRSTQSVPCYHQLCLNPVRPAECFLTLKFYENMLPQKQMVHKKQGQCERAQFK
jgi:hypothetical protein